jgi:hypothetical protein
LLEEHPDEKKKVRTEIREDDENLYLVLASSIEESMLFVLSRFRDKLTGTKIDFPIEARNVIMNEIGIANLMDLE